MKKWAWMLLLPAVLGQSHALESFRVYGFMDASFLNLETEANNPLLPIISDNYRVGLDNVNLYFDWKVNPRLRTLVEAALIKSTFSGGRPMEEFVWHLDAKAQQLPDSIKAMFNSGTYVPLETNRGMKLERAHADYYFNGHLSFRFGRFLTPAGIWNVDHASPVILGVQQPQMWSIIPIFPVYQQGFSFYGHHWLGDHGLGYEIYGSTGSAEDNQLASPDDLGGGFRTKLDLDLEAKIGVGLSGYLGKQRKTKLLHHMYVSAAEPAPGIMFPIVSPPEQTTYQEVPSVDMRDKVLGADMKVKWKDLLLQGEAAWRQSDNLLMGDASVDYFAYYILAGYKIPIAGGMAITPYAMFEHIGWENPMNDGTGFLTYFPFKNFDTYMGGLNIALSSNYYLKLEYARVLPQPSEMLNIPGQPPASNNYDPDDLAFHVFVSQIAVAF